MMPTPRKLAEKDRLEKGRMERRRSRARWYAAHVVEDADRITITTNARVAEALFLVLSGSTLQEAGDAIDINRNRVLQYMQRAGLSVHQRTLFRPGARKLRPDWRAKRLERYAERREAVVEAIKMFVDMHLRPPTYFELAALFMLRMPTKSEGGPWLVRYIASYSDNPRATTTLLKSLYILARTRAYSQSRPAHTR